MVGGGTVSPPTHALKEVLMRMVNGITICNADDVANIIKLVAITLGQAEVWLEHMHEERSLCDIIVILADHHGVSNKRIVNILEDNEVY